MRASKAYNSTQAMAALFQRMTPGSNIAANLIHVALFSGTPPTDDQLTALNTTTASQFTWNAAAIAAFATQTQMLANCVVQSIQPVMDYDNNILSLPIGGQSNLATVAAAGTPTWFMLRMTTAASAADTWAGFVAGTNATVVITGTVGDENSSADLRIFGGTVALNQPVRLADLRIKF
ncbi:hypothetical protein MPK71_gp082 [Erwinia phage pEa_SNUABM_1]|uniref:Uncharacterized protein n=1 Tax=Erwinia phage pEa_SNUABM_1 TaxID=2869543 RepID=A0AAE7XJ96_9CAUD|nr:hypothetical protein MPK71_gp082 [Erwinia phage pEa_SNUABM_1]QZE57291.1 hypothetical protein pEaSNUABM1_00082 [Erwinia phage pEa_SNUABM_1]